MSVKKAASGKDRDTAASVKNQGLTCPKCTRPEKPSSGKSSVWFCFKRHRPFAGTAQRGLLGRHF